MVTIELVVESFNAESLYYKISIDLLGYFLALSGVCFARSTLIYLSTWGHAMTSTDCNV